VFHTTATAMTMASAGPIRRKEATDMLYRSMCPAPYLPGGMVVAITVESATLYYIVYNRLSWFLFYYSSSLRI
jgi:hypothetical protein